MKQLTDKEREILTVMAGGGEWTARSIFETVSNDTRQKTDNNISVLMCHLRKEKLIEGWDDPLDIYGRKINKITELGLEAIGMNNEHNDINIEELECEALIQNILEKAMLLKGVYADSKQPKRVVENLLTKVALLNKLKEMRTPEVSMMIESIIEDLES